MMAMRSRPIVVTLAALTVALFLHSSAVAQQAAATPNPIPEELREADLADAGREFEASGLRPIGPTLIGTSVIVFDSEEHASAALPFVADHMIATLRTTGLQDDSVRAASTPGIGDEEVAYVAESLPPANPEMTVQIGLYAWTSDSVLFITYAAGLSGDQLQELFAVARAIDGRQWTNEPVATPISSRDMHSGGAWDLLPTLADMPEGFVLKQEIP